MGTPEKGKLNFRRARNGDPRQAIQVYLSDDEREKLELLSDYLRVSRSEVMRMGLEKLPNPVRDSEKKWE